MFFFPRYISHFPFSHGVVDFESWRPECQIAHLDAVDPVIGKDHLRVLLDCGDRPESWTQQVWNVWK